MSLTPLTPAEVGGALDEGEIRALHTSGPKIGMVLVYKKNNPELLVAQDAGEIIVDGPRLEAPLTLPPTNTAPPTVSGTPTVGQTLTATNGTWTGSPTFTRQWLANDVPIAGATNTTLSLAAGHEGATIKVRITGTNAGGVVEATSAAVGPVAPAA
jgi:hypothetical protein